MSSRNAIVQTLFSLGHDENVIILRRPFVRLTGSIEAALLLNQVLYWSDGRSSMPGGWFAKTDAEWMEELCLTKYAVRKARKALEDMGIIETEVRKFNGNPTVHYRLIQGELFEQWTAFLDDERGPNSDLLDSEKGSSQNPNPDFLNPEDPNTETTTETTTEDLSFKGAQEKSRDAISIYRDTLAEWAKRKRMRGPIGIPEFDRSRIQDAVATDDLGRWESICRMFLDSEYNVRNVANLINAYESDVETESDQQRTSTHPQAGGSKSRNDTGRVHGQGRKRPGGESIEEWAARNGLRRPGGNDPGRLALPDSGGG